MGLSNLVEFAGTGSPLFRGVMLKQAERGSVQVWQAASEHTLIFPEMRRRYVQ